MSLVNSNKKEGNVKIDTYYFSIEDYEAVRYRESKHNNSNVKFKGRCIAVRCKLCGATTLKWDDEIIDCRYCGELV